MNGCDFQGSLIFTKGDEIVLAKGYGLANRETKAPNTMNTTFEIGSITKQFTASAILQLEEKGKLSVQDTLDKYYPDFENGKKITIENLLTMQSGLYDYLDEADTFFPPKVGEEFNKNAEKEIDVDSGLVEKYLNYAPLRNEPGTTWFYCNTNYYLLGKIIEKVSGISYYDYMKKNIIDPVGMNNTNIEFKNTTATGYDVEGKSLSITKNAAFGCGDFNSNVIDINKWNKALLNNKVISEKSFKKMTQFQKGYCYGVIADENSIFHGGSTYVFNSFNIIFLKDDISICVLANQPIEKLSAQDIAYNVLGIFNGEIDVN